MIFACHEVTHDSATCRRHPSCAVVDLKVLSWMASETLFGDGRGSPRSLWNGSRPGRAHKSKAHIKAKPSRSRGERADRAIIGSYVGAAVCARPSEQHVNVALIGSASRRLQSDR